MSKPWEREIFSLIEYQFILKCAPKKGEGMVKRNRIVHEAFMISARRDF